MVHKISFLIFAAVVAGARAAWTAPVAVGGASSAVAGGATSVVEVVTWPASLAPAYREFAAACAAGTATRGDLIALKRFIAASAIDPALKTNLTRQVRAVYHGERKKRK